MEWRCGRPEQSGVVAKLKILVRMKEFNLKWLHNNCPLDLESCCILGNSGSTAPTIDYSRDSLEPRRPNSEVSWICVTWAPPRPCLFRRLAAGPECIDSNGRSEREHRLWLILSAHCHQSKYRTHSSQATYLQNTLTPTWHFLDGHFRRKLTLFETRWRIFCLGGANLTFTIWKLFGLKNSPWPHVHTYRR